MRRLIALTVMAISILATVALVPGQEQYSVPDSSRPRRNFNLDRKFIRKDVPGAHEPAFDDSQRETVSTPHSFNDIDSFRAIIDRVTWNHPDQFG